MEISPGIEIIGTALWLKKEQILVINDLHLGYEEALHRKGILVPKFQLQEMIAQATAITKKTSPLLIILNGDLKHEFGSILKQECKEVLQFLHFLSQQCTEIIIIQGNHDPIIKPLAEKRKIKVVKEYGIGDIILVHGDKLVETKAKTLIIGHEHPAITIRRGGKWEKYKCFLKGKWKRKEIIAVPSFNPLLEGTDILKEEVLSPFLEEIMNFEVFVVGKEEIFSFGKVKDVKRI